MKKFIIAFDTICDGWQCVKDENENPVLYDSEDEAMVELFTDALAMFTQFDLDDDQSLEDYDVTKEDIIEMKKVSGGDANGMRLFLDSHPQCNWNEEFIVPEDEFLLGRKTFFTGDGIQITGEKI